MNRTLDHEDFKGENPVPDRALVEDYLRELQHRSPEMTAESRVMGSRSKPSSASSSPSSDERDLVTRLPPIPCRRSGMGLGHRPIWHGCDTTAGNDD